MKALYMQPQVEIISFSPEAAIATGWTPDWGFEEDIFGGSEPDARFTAVEDDN